MSVRWMEHATTCLVVVLVLDVDERRLRLEGRVRVVPAGDLAPPPTQAGRHGLLVHPGPFSSLPPAIMPPPVRTSVRACCLSACPPTCILCLSMTSLISISLPGSISTSVDPSSVLAVARHGKGA